MSCVQLSENACKYFYQATITVGVEWGFLGIGVRMGVFVRSVSINHWPFYLFYMYSIGLCTCITKSPEQILMIKWSIENKLTGIITLVRFHEGLSMKKVTVFTLMVLCDDFYFVDCLYFKHTHLLNKDIYQYLWIMIFYISPLCVHMFKNSTVNSKILNW